MTIDHLTSIMLSAGQVAECISQLQGAYHREWWEVGHSVSTIYNGFEDFYHMLHLRFIHIPHNWWSSLTDEKQFHQSVWDTNSHHLGICPTNGVFVITIINSKRGSLHSTEREDSTAGICQQFNQCHINFSREFDKIILI